jgi:polar amino acid transport system permease protein
MIQAFGLTLDFQSVWRYWPALLRGVEVTLLLTGITILVGTPVGIVLGFLLRLRSPLLRLPILAAVDAVRSLPVLILILWTYYLLPAVLGRPRMGSFTLAAIALSVNLAAFIADVVRGALNGFPRPLLDAAYAVGLSRFAAARHVLIPSIARELVPVFALLYIDMLKLSSLASVIAVNEVLHVADKIRSETFLAIEVFTLVAVIYLFIVMPFAAGARALERSKHFRRVA